MSDLGSTTLIERPTRAKNADSEQKTEGRRVPTAELAECTCPDFCERDHDTD